MRKKKIYLEATGGLKTVVNGKRSLLFEGLFRTCKIVVWLLFTICPVKGFLAEHWYFPASDCFISMICKFPLGKILYRSISNEWMIIFFIIDEFVLDFDSISNGLLSNEKVGIGLGFPLGNSHGITAIFPSVKLRILFSLINVLKGSKAK